MKQLRDRSPAILISAFFAPVILLILVLMNLHVTPFGDGTFLRVDMNQQYSAFLTYLRSILLGENDLFYSFSMNSGGNFYFLFAYYLANPLNWLLALIPAERIPNAITWMILLRFGLCSLTMSLYLRRIRPSSFGWGTLLFSTSYALMSYTLVCAENYFFIDGVVMLPLVLIGIEDIFDRESILDYALALGFMLLIQFYIGWMICIFAVLYFLFRILNRSGNGNRANREALRRFIAGSLLAGSIAAIVLIPTLRALSGSVKAPPETIPFTKLNFPFFDLLSRLRAGAYTADDWKEGLPNIYSGALISALFIVFFSLKSIARREKILTLSVLLLLWLSFVSYPLEIAWHGFGIPQWWHYRNAFLFSFWMIRAAYMAWTEIRLRVPRSKTIALTVLAAGNLTLNSMIILTANLSISRSASEYAAHIRDLSALLPSITSTNGETFYRVENLSIRDVNDPMRLGYPGLSHYSSTVGSESVLFPLRRLGVEQRHYRTRFTRGTPLAAASLFGIRAIVDIDLSVVANPTALPLAFSAPTSVIRSVSYEHVPYGNLNRVYPVLSGEDFGPIYEPVEAIAVTETEGTVWTLPPGMKHPVYMFAFGNDTLPNRIDGSSDTEEVTFLTDESIFLGLEKPGETIRVTSLPDGGINGTNEAADRVFYSESIDILSRYAAVIQPRGVPVEKIGSSRLRARFTVNAETPYLFFSILYDEGWRAYVDGEETLVIPALNYFMMIQADPGTHVVELRYTPPGFRTGAALSLAGIALLMIAAFHERKRKISR